MKSAFVAILLCLANLAQAQQQPLCDDAKEVFDFLLSEHKEQPTWMGKSDSGFNYIIVANPKEKNWTMLRFNDKIACIILTGSDFRVIAPQSGAKIRTVLPD